jgi:membrane carboxypeptidase/penicillin-binding protein
MSLESESGREAQGMSTLNQEVAWQAFLTLSNQNSLRKVA